MIIMLTICLCFYLCVFLNWFTAKYVFHGEPPEGQKRRSQLDTFRRREGKGGSALPPAPEIENTSGNQGVTKMNSEYGGSGSQDEHIRPSPVLLARKQNANLFSRFTEDQNNW
jgi:hypothetical protein